MSAASSNASVGSARGHAMDVPMLVNFLAAAPFLPRGKGALILMLGGLALLPAALLLSRSKSGTQRWTIGIEQRALQQGLGACQILQSDLRTCLVAVRSCRSCGGQGGRGPCKREEQALLAAVRPRAPGARIREVSCNPLRGSCTFLVFRGSAS